MINWAIEAVVAATVVFGGWFVYVCGRSAGAREERRRWLGDYR